jgi:hypothetical protein
MSTPEDSNRVIRRLPIAVGGLAATLLFVNRVLTTAITESQARSDALGIIACAILILVGLLWQQIQPQLPDAVVLAGEDGFEFSPSLPETVTAELAWASHVLLTNTVTGVVVIYYQQQVLLRRGRLGQNSTVQPGPILMRVLEKHQPVYLVNLVLYPGRIEFDYLPENTQGVICQPIGTQGALILGAKAPRSYTRQDEKWIAAIADKLAYTLESLTG